MSKKKSKPPGWMSPSYLLQSVHSSIGRQRAKYKNPFKGKKKTRAQSKSWEDSGWKLIKPRKKPRE